MEGAIFVPKIKGVKMEKQTVNFVDVLTLMFIYLKLTKQIDWSWWVVISPMIISIIIGYVVFAVGIEFKE